MDVAVATAFEAVAAARLDDDCLMYRERRLTWRDTRDRAHRVANALASLGLGFPVPRSALAAHESGQQHLGIVLRNGNEYLEAMMGAWMARVAPFNVNYRFTEHELGHLLHDATPAVVVAHSEFAHTVRRLVPVCEVWQVADDTGTPLAPGARWYEDVLARSGNAQPDATPDPDDLYILYTGGTSGAPKGVLWRNGDARVACFGDADGRGPGELTARAGSVADHRRVLIAPPLMHGAGQWVALHTWLSGGTVVLPWEQRRFDPAALWRQIDTDRIGSLLIVGDAFARPMLDELDRRRYDLSNLNVILSGGAPLSSASLQRLRAHLPSVLVVDGLGSSETGGQLTAVDTRPTSTTGNFRLTPGNVVLNEAGDRVLAAHETELGWLARSGRLPLGYLHDPVRTARTFPVIDGVRYAVSGDRATHVGDGTVTIHGRDSSTVVTGGEKVFAEEVEATLNLHPAVADCVVAGRPSQRWGNEVVAVIEWRDGAPRIDEVLAVARQRLAGFKVPKAVVSVTRIKRSPAGKADYRWAAAVAAGHEPPTG